MYYTFGNLGNWNSANFDSIGRMGINMALELHDDRVHVAYYGADALWYARFPQGYSGE